MATKEKKLYPFVRNWHVPPGEMLEEYLQDREKTPEELATFMGVSLVYVQDLLSSKIRMTLDHAEKITGFFQMPDYYWRNSVLEYDAFLAKKRDEEVVSQKLKELPYNEMLNLGLEKEAEKIRKIADKILKKHTEAI